MTPLTNTSIAAVAYHNKDGVHIRVYYQEESGDIMELAYDEPGGGWKQTDERGELLRVGRAKIGTGISAAAWDGSSQVGRHFALLVLLPGIERRRGGAPPGVPRSGFITSMDNRNWWR